MRTLLITIISILILITGCAQNNAKGTISNDNNQNNLVRVNQPNTNINAKTDKKMTGEQIADHLVKLATSIPNVEEATAVVVGNYAVVGIDVDAKLDRSRVGTIKYSVAESLQHDPYGANAIVIADADTFERLNKMREEIRNGRPVAGVIEELAAIVGRLMPQIPTDLNPNEAPTEQNDGQLQEREQKQLDQIQNKQSKQNM